MPEPGQSGDITILLRRWQDGDPGAYNLVIAWAYQRMLAIARGFVARGRVATVAVNAFLFRQPISVGDVASFYADIVKVGRTSITVDVQVFAERHPESPVIVKVTEAVLTYVALDREGGKRPVPSPQP